MSSNNGILPVKRQFPMAPTKEDAPLAGSVEPFTAIPDRGAFDQPSSVEEIDDLAKELLALQPSPREAAAKHIRQYFEFIHTQKCAGVSDRKLLQVFAKRKIKIGHNVFNAIYVAEAKARDVQPAEKLTA